MNGEPTTLHPNNSEKVRRERDRPMMRNDAIRTLRKMIEYRGTRLAGKEGTLAVRSFWLQEMRALERALQSLLEEQAADPDGLKNTVHEDGSRPEVLRG